MARWCPPSSAHGGLHLPRNFHEVRATLELPLVAVSAGVTYRVSGALEIVGGADSSTLSVDMTGDQATQTVKLLPAASRLS